MSGIIINITSFLGFLNGSCLCSCLAVTRQEHSKLCNTFKKKNITWAKASTIAKKDLIWGTFYSYGDLKEVHERNEVMSFLFKHFLVLYFTCLIFILNLTFVVQADWNIFGRRSDF
ncbi:hypothetical protein L1887_23293 [Cichorium endivia]|nr:hypothetical protein L1887_23293 [Cichorium endivia]